MAITPETMRINDESKRALEAVVATQTNALVAAWVEAWTYLAPEFEASLSDLMLSVKDGRLTRRQIEEHARLGKALVLAQERLQELSDGLGPLVATDFASSLKEGYRAHLSAIASQLPEKRAGVVIAWDRVSEDAMDAIVKRSLENIHTYTRPLTDDVVRLMKRELVRAVAVGDNPKRTAARILKQIEGQFNGGLTRTMVISRNEVLDAHRAASMAAEKRNGDIMAGWRWSASLSARTCPSCLANHGTEHATDEPGPIDHHQGRCARVPITKSWAELGFKGIEEPAGAFPNARDWFDNLTPDTQRTIMGKERLQMLNDGKIGWADLTSRTTNGGWRDSMTVTPVKDLQRLASNRAIA